MSLSGKNTIYTKKALANAYYAFIQKQPDNIYSEQPVLKSFIPSLKGKSVLEIGCAGGIYSKHILEQNPRELTVIDFSKEMLACLREDLGEIGSNINFEVANINDELPFNAAEFDVVISSMVFHYSEDWSFLFKELNRVLVKSGRVIFSMRPFGDLRMVKEVFIEDLDASMEHIERTREEFLGVVKEYDFKILKEEITQPPLNLLGKDTKLYRKLDQKPYAVCMVLQK